MTKTDLAELKAYYATFEQISYPHTAIISLIENYERALGVIKYYGDENSYYLVKDQATGSEVRRSIELEDTESFGFQADPYSKNILQVIGGKRARDFLRSVGE